MRSFFRLLTICFVFAGTIAAQTEMSDPKRISGPHPIFPDGAEKSIYGGYIRVLITVDKKGRVSDAGTYGPLTPCSDLSDPVAVGISEAAIAAAKANVFEPFLKNGKPIEVTLPITYSLSGKVSSGKPKRELEKDSIVNGKAKSLPRPSYPPEASRAGVSGTVSVRVYIGENGDVISASPTSGHRMLLEESVRAACRARFSPTLLDGKPVKVTGSITYNFAKPIQPQPPSRRPRI